VLRAYQRLAHLKQALPFARGEEEQRIAAELHWLVPSADELEAIKIRDRNSKS
jgi:hypothetical protein